MTKFASVLLSSGMSEFILTRYAQIRQRTLRIAQRLQYQGLLPFRQPCAITAGVTHEPVLQDGFRAEPLFSFCIHEAHVMTFFNHYRSLATGIIGATLLAGCATQRGPQVDPIFQAVPGGRYACSNAGDNRNAVVKGATSQVGQAAIGGAAGGLLGNQFGSGTGRDIATGIGAAAGLAAGVWNANRMANNRHQGCLQRNSTYNNNYDGY